jgi:hypothetical protein
MATLEKSLQPASGASVMQGSQVRFSGSSTYPLNFQIATSAAALETPDVDSGAGTEEAPVRLGELPTYAFVSGAAAAAARPVFWTASFSSDAIEGCAGEPERMYRSAARELVVTAPAPAPVPPNEEPRCRVPALSGDSLPRARRLLTTAGCHLGRVSVPRPRPHGRLVVRQQHPRAGAYVLTWRHVSVRLGPPAS